MEVRSVDFWRKCKAHWLTLIQTSAYQNRLGDLSQDIGKSRSYVSGMLANDSVPGMDVVLNLGDALGASLEVMLRPDALVDERELETIVHNITDDVRQIVLQRLQLDRPRPIGRDLMLWWRQNGTRLESYGRFDGTFDLYETPDLAEGKIKAHLMGVQSLASISLGTNSTDVLDRALAPLGTERTERIMFDHKRTLEGRPVESLETLDVGHPDYDRRITIEYFRTLIPVELPDGTKLILSYSELIG